MAGGERLAKAAEAELKSGISGVPNRYTKWYGMTANWCAMFVSYCADKAGIARSIIPKTASVSNLYKFAVDRQLFYSKQSGYRPEAGDIMIQKSNGASHTGIVVSASGNGFVTIEGNSSNAVRRCSYTLSNPSLTGFFAPAYKGRGIESAKATAKKADSTGKTNKAAQGITSAVVAGVVDLGRGGGREYNSQVNYTGGLELHIINRQVDYVPICVGEVIWHTRAFDTAGRLEFTVAKDSTIDILEGNTVILKYNNENIFYGYLFEKARYKNGLISCIAYDSLRYFKNRDTLTYTNVTYGSLLESICKDYELKAGAISDTAYKLPFTVEDNQSLFEMCRNAREATYNATSRLYIMYDDFGSVCLKSADELKTDYLICDSTALDYYNMTTIDNDVYNTLMLYSDDKESGQRRKYIYRDSDTISAWGVLQKSRRLGENETADNIKTELNNYNRKKRVLKAIGCIGDTGLRGGSGVYASLDVGDVSYVNKPFFVTEAVHHFGDNYSMDLTIEERQ